MSELYELNHIVPIFSDLEKGGTSENELKEEDKYDYDQDLAILKSMHHYYFNNGSAIPYSISKEMISYIDDLIPNLKFHGQALTTKILLLHHKFSIVWEMVGRYYPETMHLFYHEIFNLCMGLWADFGDYYAVDTSDITKSTTQLITRVLDSSFLIFKTHVVFLIISWSFSLNFLD
ncbi:hypothetical protein R3W88_014526 [Solanum pinnatisectum]|uniref:Maturase K n=1 Tax=Solanum pinnatisectum TaxID=50273 RepID=A0AAV9KTD3_9SOLN|nr:hypothetical protein R3W88_014526 [Solanum pinnatisectum]